MMNIESKSKWQIRLATIAIFLLGFVAGAVALNAYHLWFSAARQYQQSSHHQRYDEAFNQLGLDEAQKIQVQQVLSETREKIQNLRRQSEPGMQEIRAQTDEKLQRILTPEQWQRFQQMREEIRQSEKQNPRGK
jgi:Spy/CpxP family protein refolding chaperone